MAILIQEESRSINWFAALIGIFVAVAIGAGIYFLFFAPVPGIEIIIPVPLQSANKISGISIDPSTVINSQSFRSLRIYTGLPGVGQLGRANPFLPY